MSFTKFKDRIWRVYDWTVRKVMRLPFPIVKAGFFTASLLLWVAWIIPKSPARKAFKSLSKLTGGGSPIRMFGGYIWGLTWMFLRLEQLRAGQLSDIGKKLRLPEKERLEAVLAEGGAILMVPHAHASIAMAEALAQTYPVTLIVRAANNEKRAAHQMQYYAKMSCKIVDVRRTDQVAVTRSVIRDLRDGRLVLAAGDLINDAPSEEIDADRGLIRVKAFGQPVGALSWPTGFAKKARVPILPAMPEQGRDELTLHIGDRIEAGEAVETTQLWMDGTVDLVSAYPSDWMFALDKKWVRALEAAAGEMKGTGK